MTKICGLPGNNQFVGRQDYSRCIASPRGILKASSEQYGHKFQIVNKISIVERSLRDSNRQMCKCTMHR